MDKFKFPDGQASIALAISEKHPELVAVMRKSRTDIRDVISQLVPHIIGEMNGKGKVENQSRLIEDLKSKGVDALALVPLIIAEMRPEVAATPLEVAAIPNEVPEIKAEMSPPEIKP